MAEACYLTSTSSTVKFSVALGGMVGFTPDVPYACMSHASTHEDHGMTRYVLV